MNPATTAGIANADAHLNDVGLPTYSELAGALRDLMNYTGGWDEKPSHPCGKAARVIYRLEAAGKFLYQDPTAQYDTPTIDLMHVSYDRILDTYLKAYPGLPPELMANDIVGHVCELIERSATQALRDDGETLEQQLVGVRPLSKEAALEKWDGFKDRAIVGGFGSLV
ncbi:hypothetical protein LJR296_008222 [Cupriavidus necator]|uniref:hypothetical protein n=1 Tax=Cupriavidus necator TaxID=106590 RepID=UPI003ECCF34B